VELPEVEVMRRDLEKDVVGRRIKLAEVKNTKNAMRVIRRHAKRKEFTSRLEGRKIAKVERRGKYLLLSLDSGEVLVVHFGMSGQFHRGTGRVPLPAHTHVVLLNTPFAVDDHRDVTGLHDSRIHSVAAHMEPSTNLGVGEARGQPPHLTGGDFRDGALTSETARNDLAALTGTLITLMRLDPASLGPLPLAGVAFAGSRGIAKVEYSTDAGRTWTEAPFKPPLSPLTWVIWQTEWTPAAEGAYELRVRATDKDGALQSSAIAASYPNGASGYHTVRIAVAKA